MYIHTNEASAKNDSGFLPSTYVRIYRTNRTSHSSPSLQTTRNREPPPPPIPPEDGTNGTLWHYHEQTVVSYESHSLSEVGTEFYFRWKWEIGNGIKKKKTGQKRKKVGIKKKNAAQQYDNMCLMTDDMMAMGSTEYGGPGSSRRPSLGGGGLGLGSCGAWGGAMYRLSWCPGLAAIQQQHADHHVSLKNQVVQNTHEINTCLLACTARP